MKPLKKFSRVPREGVRPSSSPQPPVFRTPQVCTSYMVWRRVDTSRQSEPVHKCWAMSSLGHQGPTNPGRTVRAWRWSRVDGAVMMRRRHAAATTFVGERSESHRKVPAEGMEEERRQWWGLWDGLMDDWWMDGLRFCFIVARFDIIPDCQRFITAALDRTGPDRTALTR